MLTPMILIINKHLLAMIDLFSNSHCYDALPRHSLQKSYFKGILTIVLLISFIMENIFSKIPDLGEKIFKELDNQSLVKCKEVQRSWYNFINEEKVLWFRIIQNYIRKDNEFLQAWRKVLTKAPVDFVTQVALATEQFYAELATQQKYAKSTVIRKI